MGIREKLTKARDANPDAKHLEIDEEDVQAFLEAVKKGAVVVDMILPGPPVAAPIANAADAVVDAVLGYFGDKPVKLRKPAPDPSPTSNTPGVVTRPALPRSAPKPAK